MVEHSDTSHLPSLPPHHSLPLIPIPLLARVWAQLNFVEMVTTEQRPSLLLPLYAFVGPFSVDVQTPGMPTAFSSLCCCEKPSTQTLNQAIYIWI
jgi:hypothetical protein